MTRERLVVVVGGGLPVRARVVPAARTAATSSSTLYGRAPEVACSVARLTVAWTPSTALRFFSMCAAHEAQLMPSRSSVTVLANTPRGYQAR